MRQLRPHRGLALLALLALSGTAAGEEPLAVAGGRPDHVVTGSVPGSLVRRGSTADCTLANQLCPAISVAGDAPATTANGTPTPLSGYADPSLRRDPSSTRLWLAYSWPSRNTVAGDSGVLVDNHIARSEDGGTTFRFSGVLWSSQPATLDPQFGDSGHVNTEVVSLAPRADGAWWYAARLTYFTPATPATATPRLSSFTLHVSSAATPLGLSTAPEVVLGGGRTAAGWHADVNLSLLGSDVGGCTWNDPALLAREGTLYLAAECQLFNSGGEDVDNEFVALFATRPDGTPKSWIWRYLGKLSDAHDARELGGLTLLQTDLAYSWDGTLLAIVSPSAPTPGGTLATHFGCKAVEVASLEPPALARDAAGRLKVRASVTASDLAATGGPAACAYDPAALAGILLVRRDYSVTGKLAVSIVRSGVRP